MGSARATPMPFDRQPTGPSLQGEKMTRHGSSARRLFVTLAVVALAATRCRGGDDDDGTATTPAASETTAGAEVSTTVVDAATTTAAAEAEATSAAPRDATTRSHQRSHVTGAAGCENRHDGPDRPQRRPPAGALRAGLPGAAATRRTRQDRLANSFISEYDAPFILADRWASSTRRTSTSKSSS